MEEVGRVNHSIPVMLMCRIPGPMTGIPSHLGVLGGIIVPEWLEAGFELVEFPNGGTGVYPTWVAIPMDATPRHPHTIMDRTKEIVVPLSSIEDAIRFDVNHHIHLLSLQVSNGVVNRCTMNTTYVFGGDDFDLGVLEKLSLMMKTVLVLIIIHN